MKLVLSLLAVVACLTGSAIADERLGRISFPNSGNAAAQPHFIRGVLLLHSFEFDDAAEAFREAKKADPGFALAYWGEALTHTHPLWRHQDQAAALKVLAELGPTKEARLARAPTERERDYLATLDTLYGPGEEAEVLGGYARAMEALSAKYPDDDEARALHAVAILATNVERRDFTVDMRAAALVEEIFLRNQEHPGALHYMIHAYDNPMHAPLGLRPARRYGRIAEHAAHALHMTSHIFLALGMWDDSVAANEASFAASKARLERKKLGPNEHGYHAYLWLAYSYLQQGRLADARRVVAHTYELLGQAQSRRAGYHYAYARAHFVVDGEQWGELPPEGAAALVPPAPAAASLFANGLAAARRGDLAAAEAALAQLRALSPSGGHEGHHGPSQSALSPAEREGIVVTTLQLRGLVAIAKGDRADGLTLLQDAARAEDVMPYEYGPPFPVKPSRELLGESLLETGRAAEAAEQFRLALKRNPGRALALRGLRVAGSH
jgi:tetratricopeptide (TPR) repeat protein